MKISKKKKIQKIIEIVEYLEQNGYIFSINQLEKMFGIDIKNYKEIWEILRKRRKFNNIEGYKNRFQVELRKKYKENLDKLLRQYGFTLLK